MSLAELEPNAAPDALVASQTPYLIGVRHHSAALAAVVPTLLETFAPTRVLIELPADLGEWLRWLGAPDLQAPIALSANGPGGLAFYPFADFSPELAAIRWASARGVAVEAIDRPVAARIPEEREERSGGLLRGLDADPWDALVESRAPAPAEALRRAALAFGWMLRADTLHGGGIQREDQLREGYMRFCVQRALAEPGARVCAIVGAFHANALLPIPLVESPPENVDGSAPPPFPGALVPYDFELLDTRSGYPAGIEDPTLAQHAYECFTRGVGVEAVLPQLLVEIARELRARGHVASFADLREAARMAHDLAALRGKRGPSRRELLEVIASTMGQGEPLGRGRVLARALEAVLVGHRRGVLPAAAPRSGLVVATEALVSELGLPGPRDKDGKDLTLDPHRSELDRRRLVLLGQLRACTIPYGESLGGGLRGARAQVATLTTRVRLRWTAETSAHLELSGMYGVTPRAAAEGGLRRALARLEGSEDDIAAGWLSLLAAATEAGLEELVSELLSRQSELFVPYANVPQLTAALLVCARLAEGQVPTLTSSPRAASAREALELASLAALMGMLGSTDDDDVRALGELLGLLGGRDLATLRHTLEIFARDGSPLMQGAGHVARVMIGSEDAERWYATFVSWFEHGLDGDTAAASHRSGLLRGALLLAGASFEGDPRFLTAILAGLDQLADDRFLLRLPSLRAGFDVLSPASRARLLEALGAPLSSLELTIDRAELEALARADRAGLAALQALVLNPSVVDGSVQDASFENVYASTKSHAIGLLDRLRLLLGQAHKCSAPSIARYGIALDELYGYGEGEGARAGTGSAYPTAREWGDELAQLFGERVREEVLGRAAAAGQGAALALIDPEQVTPSIDLLERILSLKGGLAESELEHLKRLARRVIDELVKELATATRPALAGLVTPRATRRRVGPLDLRRTVRANLDTAHLHEGAVRLMPRDFVFRTRVRKSLDWHIVLVVDVSGSMEPSVLHAAMMAGILGALPAVTLHFVTVSERVVDLSEHVSDPLELLLSVRVGGGTLLSKGLRYARRLLRVPSRSLVVMVSDFDEGGAVSALVSEVRALVEGGSTVLGVAALGEAHAPRYNTAIAAQLVAAGMPIAALSPLELAGWVRDTMRGGRT